jgi:hypothetical protein
MPGNSSGDFWKEFFAYDVTFTNLPAGTGVAFTDAALRIDTDSDFEFLKSIYQPTSARVRVKYRDDTNTRFLQKAAQDIRTIGGTSLYSMAPGNPTPPGFVPFIWPRPYIIAGSTTLTVSAADFSGLISTFRLTFHGAKIRPGKAPWDRKFKAVVPYVYPINPTGAVPGTVTVAANGVQPTAIPTDNDAHFLVYKVVGTRTGACTLTVKDGDRDREWMNQAVHFDNFVGNGHFPNILSTPRFVRRGSVIAITLTDLSGAANTVELNLVGVKLYE